MSDGTLCPRCERVHVTHNGGLACRGHISSGERQGWPCGNSPRAGLKVCRYHGGANARSREAGQRRSGEAKAAHLMRRFGGPIDTTPTEALLDTVRWTAGYVAWLREKVASMRTDRDLVWGQTRAKVGGEDRGTTYASGANAWLTLLGEWSDRLVKVCEAAIRAGIEERRVRLAEGQGKIIADVIRSILEDLHLSDEQQGLVSDVVPRHLRLIAN